MRQVSHTARNSFSTRSQFEQQVLMEHGTSYILVVAAVLRRSHRTRHGGVDTYQHQRGLGIVFRTTDEFQKLIENSLLMWPETVSARMPSTPLPVMSRLSNFRTGP